MTRNHVIISGTGRAGTTFLVQLLTELGLDTGFKSMNEGIYENCNAGMELDLRQSDAPYIVKSPWLCDYLEGLLEEKTVSIDHAIIPIRNLFSAAESRRFVSSQQPEKSVINSVTGGLWDTQIPDNQEQVLSMKLYKLINTLIKYDISTTFLYFPEFVQNPVYLYTKLSFLFNKIGFSHFQEVFNKVSKPELVHTFSQKEKTEKTIVRKMHENWFTESTEDERKEIERQFNEKIKNSFQIQVGEQEKTIKDLKNQIQQQKTQLSESNNKKEAILKEIFDLKKNQIEREQVLQDLNEKLLEIYSGTAWKIIQWMWKFRLWMVPVGSSRETTVKGAIRLFHKRK